MNKGWTIFFPVAQIFLCIGASLVYVAYRDWRHAIYWAAAAVLTASVTF